MIRHLSATDGDTIQKGLDLVEGKGIAFEDAGFPDELRQFLVKPKAGSGHRMGRNASWCDLPVPLEPKRIEQFFVFRFHDNLFSSLIYGTVGDTIPWVSYLLHTRIQLSQYWTR